VKVTIQYWAVPQLEERQTRSPGRQPTRHPCCGARPSSAAGKLSWAHRRDLCIIFRADEDLNTLGH